MPRPKLTDEERINKTHEDMLDGMIFLYRKAWEKDKNQYMKLKTAYEFLGDMLKQLGEKFNGKS